MSQNAQLVDDRTIETDVPARMDRLPWSGWHLRVITALGTSWMLDGLQVTLTGSLAGILGDKRGLGLTTPQITAGATTYLAGAVIGAILFGYLTDRLPLHLLPFALGSFLGPLLLGHLFDRIGRKPMIIATYGIAGVLLAAVAFPFAHGSMSVRTLDISFSVIFFIASSAASAAYLTVSEIFPLEIRAFAIAIFYAIGTLVGGVGAPFLFGELIASGSRWHVSIGFLIGASLMVLAAICEGVIGVEAAGKSLESISKPLQSRS